MRKIYTNYDEYLQDAYEQQSDRYTHSNNVNHDRTQETARQQGEECQGLNSRRYNELALYLASSHPADAED